MEIFKDIYTFISCLDGVDIIFLVAIVTLLILLVTLVYFIKINRDEEDNYPNGGDNYSNGNSNNNSSGNNDKINDIVDKIEVKQEKEENYNDEEGELLDLEGLTKKLKEQANNPNIVPSTEYEKEQEEKAIISYDELLKKHNNYAINYEKEERKDDLVIRKVDLSNLINSEVHDEIKNVRVISYEKEEAFLSALKELNRLLN